MAETLGRYLLDRRIAVGGMGEVFLARQTGPDGFERPCVVKTMHAELASDQDFVNLFLEEARLSARLTHPNIAQVYDFGKVGDVYYLAIELVEGPSLRDVVRAMREKKRFLDIALGCRVVIQAAHALSYVHRVNGPDGKPLHLVHRDVSPANLLVSKDGLVKLIDFGIAKARTTARRTGTGVVRGKLAYIAPEQVESQPIDARADIFSLGLVLYEVLTLRRAVQGATDVEILQSLHNWDIPNVRSLRPEIPESIEAVVQIAMETDRRRRYQTAEVFADALESAMTQEGLIATSGQLTSLAREIPPSAGSPASPGTHLTPSSPGWPRNATPSGPKVAASRGEPKPVLIPPSENPFPPDETTEPKPGSAAEPTRPEPRPAVSPSRRSLPKAPAEPDPALFAPPPPPRPMPSRRSLQKASPEPPADLLPPPPPKGTGPTEQLPPPPPPKRRREVEETGDHDIRNPPVAQHEAEDDAALDDPSTVVSSRPGPPRRSPAIPIIAAVAGVAVVAFGLYFALGTGSEPLSKAKASALDAGRRPAVVTRPDAGAVLVAAARLDAGPPVEADAGARAELDAAVADTERPDAGTEASQASKEPVDAGPPRGWVALEVSSTPSMTIYLDGHLEGPTPKAFWVKAGRHRIVWKSGRYSRDITVKAVNQPIRLDWHPRR